MDVTESRLLQQMQTELFGNIPQSPNDSLSFVESMKEIGRAWKGSIVIKLLSIIIIGILILFCVFLFLMGSNVTTKSLCDGDLNKQKDTLKDCKISVSILQNQKSNLEYAIQREQNSIDELQSQIKILQVKTENITKEIESQEGIIAPLKKQVDGLKGEENKLKEEYDNLQNKSEKLKGELELAKKKFMEIEGKLEQRKKRRKNYIIYTSATGGVNVVTMGGIVYLRYQLKSAERIVEEEANRKANLEVKADDLSKIKERVETEIKEIDATIIQIKNDIEMCNLEVETETEKLKASQAKEKELRERTKVLMDLALDLTLSQFLSQENKTEIETSAIFNSTEQGFEEKAFKKATKDKKPTLVVMVSDQGFVFGAFVGVTWERDDTTKEFKRDEKAFTFSTTNHKVCAIKDPEKAIKFSDKYLLELGDGEIQIGKGDSTKADAIAVANKNFDCGNVNNNTFYAESSSFKVEELIVYHVEIRHNK